MVEHELGPDPYSGVAVVFRLRRADRIKVLWWDGTGLVLASKRLEQGRFAWPAVRDGVTRLSRALFEGQQATVEGAARRGRFPDRPQPPSRTAGPEAAVEDLRSRVASLTDRNQHLNDVNRRLEHLVRELRRAMFGQKSEKLHRDQLLLAFEELKGALAEAEADAAREAPRRAAQPRSSARPPAAHL